jgi:hypothetical protein
MWIPKTVNLLFFGNFYKMSLEEYTYGMEKMMDDKDFLYGSLIKDVYAQGVVLGKKYRLLRIAYNIFMFGLLHRYWRLLFFRRFLQINLYYKVYAKYFNRDLSWLTFNQRVLEEAANPAAPLMERIRFLSIYSSNLDEFYRVRMPVLRALQKIGEKKSSDIDSVKQSDILQQASAMILEQQRHFGDILTTQLIPLLRKEKVNLLYNQPLPQFCRMR